MHLNKKRLLDLIKATLAEDIGGCDITTNILVPKGQKVKATILTKERSIICGLGVCELVFKVLDKRILFRRLVKDGQVVNRNSKVATCFGNARSILMAERSALNMLSHLSGIATLTNRFVAKVKPSKVKIMDTRKTLAGLRLLEKYAVACGGGYNHRMGLYDQMLIKDNHLRLVNSQWSLVNRAIKKAKAKRIATEIEVNNLKQLKQALILRPDIIMLDNMEPAKIKKAIKIRNSFSRGTKLEASGAVTLKNVRSLAATGVDFISIGSLTDSASAIDMSLEIV